MSLASNVLGSLKEEMAGKGFKDSEDGRPLVYWHGMDAVATDLLEHHGYTDESILNKWQFKWSQDSSEIHGPYNSQEIMDWADEGYFEEGLWISKHEEGIEPQKSHWVPWFESNAPLQ